MTYSEYEDKADCHHRAAAFFYFYYRTDVPIYMLLDYAKAARADLTPNQRHQVAKLTMLLKEQHVRGD